MTVAPQADTELIVGTVASVEQKGADRWQIHVTPDGSQSQYTKGLWTKDQGIVQAMAASIGQRLAFNCGASHWTRQDGTPVRSLWLNGYGDPDGMAAQPQQPVQQQPQQQWQTQPAAQPAPSMPAQTAAAPQPDQREMKIHRQTATKVAAQLLKHLTPEQQTFDTLIKISERLVHYYDNGVAWQQQDQQQDDGGPGLSAADDGIPF